MLTLIWLSEEEGVLGPFTEADRENAANDGDARRCPCDGCDNPVGWVTGWSRRGTGDAPYAKFEDCAQVGEEVWCYEHAELALLRCEAREVTA